MTPLASRHVPAFELSHETHAANAMIIIRHLRTVNIGALTISGISVQEKLINRLNYTHTYVMIRDVNTRVRKII